MKIRSLLLLMFVCYSLLAVSPWRQETTATSQETTANQQEDWPLFRGNAMQTGVAQTTLPDKLEIRWKVDLKKGIESTAAIVKDTVYVGCFDDHLHAFDLATGKPKWKYKASGGIKAAPSVYRGMVFVGDEDGVFHCVDAVNGNKIWTFDTNGEITGGANFADDKVIVGSHDSTLYCLEIKTKKLLWKVKIEGPVNGSALVANGQTFLAGCDSNLHVIELAKGKTLAKIELSGQAAATAALFANKLYIGNMNNELQEVDLKKKDVEWTYVPKRGQPFYSSAAVTDKYVVVGSRDRQVHALQRSNGNLAWAFSAEGRIDCSPVIAGSRVYFGSTSGLFYVVDLNTGKELQKEELGQGIVASPAVAHGCVVIGTTDGKLYCLGKK